MTAPLRHREMEAEARKQSEVRAILSLSHTQRRHAHEYKRWALQAESEGNLPRYQKYRAESDQLWRNAKWNLAWAKRRMS